MNLRAQEEQSNNKFDLAKYINDQIKYDMNGKCSNAFKILSKPEVLKVAYETIKSKPGNMTPGVDNETLDGISNE